RLGVAPSAGMTNERETVLANVTYRGVTALMPVWLLPARPEDPAPVHYGYGRERGGKIANGIGVNVYPFRHADAMNGGPGLQIANANRGPYKVACTQEH